MSAEFYASLTILSAFPTFALVVLHFCSRVRVLVVSLAVDCKILLFPLAIFFFGVAPFWHLHRCDKTFDSSTASVFRLREVLYSSGEFDNSLLLNVIYYNSIITVISKSELKYSSRYGSELFCKWLIHEI